MGSIAETSASHVGLISPFIQQYSEPWKPADIESFTTSWDSVIGISKTP